jgi:hypothetical protein
MKKGLSFLIFISVFIFASAWASEPLISKNVHVVQNATSAQCPATWRGTGNPDIAERNTALGQADVVGSDVRSCTGCAIDKKSGDCVCSKCYDYSDN